MILVEKQIVTPKDSYYKTLLGETRKSKDLRNAALFVNGAANALRKYLQEVRNATQAPADIGLVMNPVQASVLFQVIRPRVSRTRKDKGTSKETSACAKQTVKIVNRFNQF